MFWEASPSLRAAVAHLMVTLTVYCVMKLPLKDPWTGCGSVQ